MNPMTRSVLQQHRAPLGRGLAVLLPVALLLSGCLSAQEDESNPPARRAASSAPVPAPEGKVLVGQAPAGKAPAVAGRPSGCTSPEADEVRALWKQNGPNYVLGTLWSKRLTAGDTYALYDAQSIFQNVVTWAERCGEQDVLQTWVRYVDDTYRFLTPDAQGHRQWVCTSGAICTGARLIGREVQLNSTQFLALATSLARTQARTPGKGAVPPAGERDFVAQTVDIAFEHLLRWGSPAAQKQIRTRIATRPDDLKVANSSLFMTDRDLWQLVIYAELAGILEQRADLRAARQARTPEWTQLSAYLGALLDLVSARAAVQEIDVGGRRVKAVNPDGGFWRLHPDLRFAGYRGAQSPAGCATEEGGRRTKSVAVDVGAVPVVEDLGWDISHARRFVIFADRLAENHSAMASVWGVAGSRIPGPAFRTALVNQFVGRVWNQDRAKPLFTNYFNGANGWYRVAYDNGSGTCRAGTPPWGLSASVLNGGYLQWGAVSPEIAALAQSFLALRRSTHPADQAFVQKNYPFLQDGARSTSDVLSRMNFLASAVVAR